MTIEQEMKAVAAQWKAEGWSDSEIESSLVAYFSDSPTFIDDAGSDA